MLCLAAACLPFPELVKLVKLKALVFFVQFNVRVLVDLLRDSSSQLYLAAACLPLPGLVKLKALVFFVQLNVRVLVDHLRDSSSQLDG